MDAGPRRQSHVPIRLVAAVSASSRVVREGFRSVVESEGERCAEDDEGALGVRSERTSVTGRRRPIARLERDDKPDDATWTNSLQYRERARAASHRPVTARRLGRPLPRSYASRRRSGTRGSRASERHRAMRSRVPGGQAAWTRHGEARELVAYRRLRCRCRRLRALRDRGPSLPRRSRSAVAGCSRWSRGDRGACNRLVASVETSDTPRRGFRPSRDGEPRATRRWREAVAILLPEFASMQAPRSLALLMRARPPLRRADALPGGRSTRCSSRPRAYRACESRGPVRRELDPAPARRSCAIGLRLETKPAPLA